MISAGLVLGLLLAGQSPGAVERWRNDVAVTRAEFLEKDKSYSPERRTEARQRLDALDRALPGLSDQQIVAELARVGALADNAHTRAYLLRNRGWWRRYPVRIWKFSDGWRVVAVRPGQEEMLGARILSISGMPVARAEAAVRPLFAGPQGWADYMAGYTLTSPDALLGTEVIRGAGEARFGLEKDGRRFEASVAPVEAPRRTAPEENWWFLSPAHSATQGWVHVLAGRTLPPYLERPATWYDLRRCDGLLYVGFNRSEDQPDRPTLAEFGDSLRAELARAPDTRLVIDLRFNTGGNLQKTQALFEELAQSPVGQQRDRLFVVMGPSTFSAGITPAAILRERSRAIFVGTEPGDRLTFWAEGGNVVLPNSGITMHYADRAHVYAAGGRPVPADLLYLSLNAGSLKPDLPARLSFADYAAGRDPSGERIVPGGLRC